MNKQLSLVVAALAVSGLALTGCSKNPSAGDNVIHIASASPLSGGTANAGKDNESGARLAVEEINAKGGVDVGGKKYLIDLISEDDGADAKQGTIVAQKITDNKAIIAVVGHYNSGVSMAANPIYAKANVVQITPSATNPDVTVKSPKTANGVTSVYRMVAHDGMQGPALAIYANKKGLKKLAIVDDATTYGKGMADQVEKKARELGIEIVSRESATDKTTDFKAVLTQAKASGADGLMWGGLDDTAATFAKQARELGITATFLMPDAVCTDNYISLAGDAAKGTICSVTGIPLSEMKEGMAFKERFEKRFNGQKVQGFSPFAYDAILTLVEAIKKAGTTTDAAKIAQAMVGIQAQGLSGAISFQPNGERADTVITILEEDGKAFVPVDKIK